MILGIGLDILHLPRLHRIITQRGYDRLARRILTDAEQNELAQLVKTTDVGIDEQRARFLAVRWTAKEAAYKALYPHYKPTWKDGSILKMRDSDKPHVRFEGDFVKHVDKLCLHLSVSHDGDYVASVILAEQT